MVLDKASATRVAEALNGNRVLLTPWLAAVTMSKRAADMVALAGGLRELALDVLERMTSDDALSMRFDDATGSAADARFVVDGLTLTFDAYVGNGSRTDHDLERSFARTLDGLSGSYGLVGEMDQLCLIREPRSAMSLRRGRLSAYLETLANNDASFSGQAGADAFWDAALSQEMQQLLGPPATVVTISELIERTITDGRVANAYLTTGASRMAALTN